MKKRIFSFLWMVMLIPSFYVNALPQHDLITPDNLFSKTKPQCVGLYVVDVPESFKNDRNKARYDDFEIKSQLISPSVFKQRIALREQELNAEGHRSGYEVENLPFIKEIITLPNDKGVIFDRNSPYDDDSGRVLEAHIYIHNTAFIIETDIVDLSNPNHKERKYINAGLTEAQLTNKPAKLAALRSLISRLSGRLEHEIPAEKGVCIPNGFIADDNKEHEIVTGFNYENNDFLFSLINDNTVIVDAGDTLFGRSNEMNEVLKKAHMETIKKEALTLHGIPAEKWLFRDIELHKQKGSQVYFILYANEAVATAIKPVVRFNLHNQYRQTRYSETQMIEIGNRLINSLRYKPNAF
ncbi:hypothetical protein CHU32_05910 [Superficieibacter electus]|uniref:Tle cognate immunity protein 4 C-terminal domain-containing protein n=1 Tax=Superficieibacter electus TaxID=2022662 RepID=A0A2P5GT77_9ENTR|nr:T6SS immunity protein Tli4 family protein [Superficieibacter electus]POP46289.1 hypothetical protein CHU33_05895 [Superficieibacter electus]POP49759.1 hypothetical protein CHU32_05910 [Superficieibacter electus]